MIHHPTPAELEACVWDHKARGGSRKIILHVVECASCFAIALPHLRAMFGEADPPPRDLSPKEEDAYDAALSGAFAKALKQAPLIQEQKKLEVLALLAGREPNDLPDIPDQLRGIPLIEALLEMSASFRHEDPERMIRFAEWAWLHTDKAPIPEARGPVPGRLPVQGPDRAGQRLPGGGPPLRGPEHPGLRHGRVPGGDP